jgi:Transposase zinc-binding domain/Phage integrase, N-terminal SAM-like domain
MTNKTISPLRQRMIEDMTVRRFTAKTQSDYIRSVRNLAAFLGRSPDTATAEDLRRFQLHQTETRIRPPTINGTVSALRFFFTVTLGRADVARSLTFVAEPRKIPVVLSPEEVARFLEAAPGPKYKAALGAAYGAGLRLGQLKVMSAIESCRTASLGGHVVRCEDCSHTQIAYNSCRNRHCPKCQGSQALAWMEERKAELLGIPYFHVVFTLPARIAAIAYQNKAVIYDLLFKASSQTMLTIAADPKRLGVKIGFTSVLHTWGSAMTQNPHSRYRALSSP